MMNSKFEKELLDEALQIYCDDTISNSQKGYRLGIIIENIESDTIRQNMNAELLLIHQHFEKFSKNSEKDPQNSLNQLANRIKHSKSLSGNNSEIDRIERFNISDLYIKHKNEFSTWANDSFTKKHAKDVTRECSKLFKCGVRTILDIRNEVMTNESLPPRTNNGFRTFLNFLEKKSSTSPIMLNRFREYVKGGVNSKEDKKVPTEKEILTSIDEIKTKYSFDTLILYYFLLESGCRFGELKKLILEFNTDKLVINDEFAYYKLYWRRGRKNSFILFSRAKTMRHIMNNLNLYQEGRYLERFRDLLQDNSNVISSKYVRKFVYTEMVHSSEIDTIVANLFQGRINKGDVGQKNYLDFERYLVKWYPLYIKYLKKLLKE